MHCRLQQVEFCDNYAINYVFWRMSMCDFHPVTLLLCVSYYGLCPWCMGCRVIWLFGTSTVPNTYFLGVHKFIPIDVLTGDSGWLACFSRHKLALLRLWNRLVTLPDTRLTNNIFLWDLSFKEKAGSWSNVLNKLLSETEIEYNFENLLPYSLDQMYFILKSIERDALNSRRYSKPKLRYYSMYESDFEQDEYLDLSIP